MEPVDTSSVDPVRERFEHLANLTRKEGVLAGTAHRRILIPHDKFTEQDIHHMGFVPVNIAIPEAGQDKFRSFRHPDNNFHIHSHPEGWTMHEDNHAASTMLASKAHGLMGKSKAFASGIPHVNEEGIPGLYYYAKGVLGGHKSTAQRVHSEMTEELKSHLAGLSSSPTYTPPEAEQMPKAAEADQYKLQGHMTHQGLRVAVENAEGSVRTGKDKDGKPWRTEMKYPYGYLKGTKGADGEEVDAYVGPKKDAENAYVVHQKDHEGKYDEDKVMLGFASKTQAREAYLAHYNTKKFLGPIKEVPMDRLKEMIESKETLRKIAGCLDELTKLGAVSEAQAAKSLERYRALEAESQTPAQVARYAALGAVAGPVVGAVGNAIRGGAAPGVSMLGHLAGASGPGAGRALRSIAGSAVTGAISSGAIPIVRHELDRQAEMRTLGQYLADSAGTNKVALDMGSIGSGFRSLANGVKGVTNNFSMNLGNELASKLPSHSALAAYGGVDPAHYMRAGVSTLRDQAAKVAPGLAAKMKHVPAVAGIAGPALMKTVLASKSMGKLADFEDLEQLHQPHELESMAKRQGHKSYQDWKTVGKAQSQALIQKVDQSAKQRGLTGVKERFSAEELAGQRPINFDPAEIQAKGAPSLVPPHERENFMAMARKSGLIQGGSPEEQAMAMRSQTPAPKFNTGAPTAVGPKPSTAGTLVGPKPSNAATVAGPTPKPVMRTPNPLAHVPDGNKGPFGALKIPSHVGEIPLFQGHLPAAPSSFIKQRLQGMGGLARRL